MLADLDLRTELSGATEAEPPALITVPAFQA